MYGNGRPGPIASGVRTGKICSRKWRSSSCAGAPDSLQETILIPCSASAGGRRRGTGGVAAILAGGRARDPLEHLGGEQAVGAARVDPRLDLVVDAGDADHEELVEVGDEDRQELHALDQRQRLVLGELEHAVVEVEPRELAVDEQPGSRIPGGCLGVHAGPGGAAWPFPSAVVSCRRRRPRLMRAPPGRRPIAASSAGRRSTTSSPLAIPASPPFFIRACAPVIS